MRTAIVADDEPITRMDVSQMLEEAGISVLGEASDGFDAIELCRRVHPNVVLMDVRMPVFDGLDAAAAINGEKLADCVILLTAFSDQDLIERANEVGVSGYLVKPIEQRLLVPTIEVALAQSRRLRDAGEAAEEAQKKLYETKIIGRAKAVLAADEKISEADAYRQMQQLAMNKRCGIIEIAEMLTKQAKDRTWSEKCKRMLMERRKIGEKEAFEIIARRSKEKGISREEAARQLYRGENG